MNEELEELLVIGEDDYQPVDVGEYDEYLVVNNPMSDDPEDWAVIILKGKYENFVVKFDNVGLHTKTGDIAYDYTILATGTEGEVEYDQVEFTNMCTSILSQIIVDMHKQGSQGYVDLETGEEIKY